MKITDSISNHEERLKAIESRFQNLGYDMRKIVVSETNKRFKIAPQSESFYGLFTALCIETRDTEKQNRVRFFSPLFSEPETPIDALDWAYPISAAGGFDDCGLNWIPPAGSTLAITFENGSRTSPCYMGTLWHRDRGPDGNHNWGYNIQEYLEIHEGHRLGYNVGLNDGSQVFPPWNTENYMSFDSTSGEDFEDDPDAQERLSYPYIYGLKTPQKHMLKFVDGDYKCKHRWARAEWQSSTGNIILMKDDHMRPCGQWAHPNCGCGGGDVSDCEQEENQVEDCEQGVCESNKCANPYYKHMNECRIHQGPGTPQNPTCELCQSGIQFMSVSGHTFFMSDEVEEPQGEPNWERSTQPFDFGCTNLYLGKTKWQSATGHSIEMSDVEELSELRGVDNYIRILSATGNKIELNDHTESQPNCPGCPPNLAGSRRGITLQSTSNHTIEMIDEENEQCGQCRMAGGIPVNKARKAFVKIRTGYGLMIEMKDDNSQQETQNQSIQIFCPHKDNEIRGPHIMRFQEVPDGPGYVFLKVGGDYICITYDSHFTVVGTLDGDNPNPSDKIVVVTKDYFEVTEEQYVNLAKQHTFIADEYIYLIAGTELDPRCKSPAGDCTACVWPVVCLSPKGLTVSDRVFVSASSESSCVSIFQLEPFHKCEPFESC